MIASDRARLDRWHRILILAGLPPAEATQICADVAREISNDNGENECACYAPRRASN
jgi:hypothetical protein